MRILRSIRSLFVVLVLALLAPSTVEARPSEAPRTDLPASQSVIDHFIGWLMALWGDNGCTMDPDGLCRSGVSMAPVGSDSLDEGCTADQNGGGCRESLDEGCGWDPNGGSCHDNS